MWFKKKVVKETDWNYLGWSEPKYSNNKGKTTESCVVHFYVDAADDSNRKVEHDQWSHSKMKTHPFYQKRVIPWLNGEDIYVPVYNPASYLHTWAKKQGWTWDGTKEWWVHANPTSASPKEDPPEVAKDNPAAYYEAITGDDK